MAAIREAISEGGNRGASTLTQQVAKNVFLWQGRSWLRKAMEAVLTPPVELIWSKRRILEVYLNVAEFGEGVFGVQAAAQHYFNVDARDLTAVQAARLAAVLPNPKERDPANPTSFLRKRAREIIAGAETIAADGRSACFDR
jgi:monofunctional biosynthetic peptidoglycan transglycosylase